jgi:hypothetical protein
VTCPQCQALAEEDTTFCSNCGYLLTGWRIPPYIDSFPSSTKAPEMTDPFLSPGIPGTPDEEYGPPDSLDATASNWGTGNFGAYADQYIPSSSASQYPRTPGEQYLPDNRAGQYIPAARAPAGEFRPDMRRLSRAEQTAGGATLIVLISLFLPWFRFAELGTSISISISGTTAHRYLVVVVLLAVLTAGYLLWRSGWEEFPLSLPITHEALLLAAVGLQMAIVAIAFLDLPVPGLSREIGAYLALIASAVAVGPAVLSAIRSRQASA